MTTMYDSRPDTYVHILAVQRLLMRCVADLQQRLLKHDLTKLEPPEREFYDQFTSRLRNTPYNSFEYRATIREMAPAMHHHFAHNPHHPEAFPDGIHGMSLLDLIEMLCDWSAAAKRQPSNLSLSDSIEINQERFGYGDDVKRLLHNTVSLLEPMEDSPCLPSAPTNTAANTRSEMTSPLS